MTADDAARLHLYRQKRGPLSHVLRMEAGLAMVCTTVLNAAGAKHKDGRPFQPSDFMPWAGERKEMSVDDLILEWARSNAGG